MVAMGPRHTIGRRRTGQGANTAKKVLDPSIIQATRPQDVGQEVMERTGINRTTAQRLTASMPADMRQKRRTKALMMLRSSKAKAEVSRTFGLSPSRVSAMFKGMKLRSVGLNRSTVKPWIPAIT
jgi:hypothetical protein